MKKLHTILFSLGLLFLVFLVYRTGPAELARQLASLGWGLVPMIIGEGVAEFLHAISWRYCLSRPHQSIPLLRLFRIHMAGYAISYLTPTASLGGEATKAALLADYQKGPGAMTGVIIGKLSFALAHLSFVILGGVLLLRRLTLPRALWIALLAITALLATGIVAFLFIQKHGKLGALTRWLSARHVGRNALQKWMEPINRVDDALREFYQDRPFNLLLSVLWHTAGYSIGIVTTWYFMHRMVGGGASLELAAGAFFLGLWFDLLTFAVPLGLGVLEGSRGVAFQAVGYGALAGITFGVVTRAAQLFWAAAGLVNYAWLISAVRPRTHLDFKSEYSSARNGKETAYRFDTDSELRPKKTDANSQTRRSADQSSGLWPDKNASLSIRWTWKWGDETR